MHYNYSFINNDFQIFLKEENYNLNYMKMILIKDIFKENAKS